VFDREHFAVRSSLATASRSAGCRIARRVAFARAPSRCKTLEAEALSQTAARHDSHHGVEVAQTAAVRQAPTLERRQIEQNDRRKNSRGGRRRSDPHTRWRRVVWFFAAYVVYLGIQSIPATIRRLFKRERPA